VGSAVPGISQHGSSHHHRGRSQPYLCLAASAWEIATKVRLGKLPGAEAFERDFLDIVDDAGYTLLVIDAGSVLRAGRLSSEHCDPFDRILAAQALADGIPILSTDAKLDSFGIRRIW